MIKLVCEKCTHVWYTSNTNNDQECDECRGRLIEVDFVNVKEIENISTIEFIGSNVVIERKKLDKAIHVNC